MDKETGLRAFIPTEGALYNTSFRSVKDATVNIGIEPVLIGWIDTALKSRIASVNIGDYNKSVSNKRMSPKSGTQTTCCKQSPQ